MVSVEQLYLNFGGFDLFKGVSFIVNSRDRIGLVGRNGTGKTTLLKIFAGLQQPSSGRVVIPNGSTVGYLPQQMKVTGGKTVMEEAISTFDDIIRIGKKIEKLNNELATRDDYDSSEYHKLIEEVTGIGERYHMLGGENFHADIEKTLIGLGFVPSDFTRSTSEFSGGWRMRIELAKILLKKPSVFLLDEPTNHLDIESIQWLENFLKDYAGAVVLVSHDRVFLDNVTNRTVEISLGNIYDYKVSYTEYTKLREERREQQLAAYRNQQKMIQDTENFIERFRYKATKAVQVQSRVKQLEKLERIEIEEEDARKLNIKFPPAPRSGDIVFEAKQMSKSYGDLKVLDDIDLILERGNRIAFLGKNGEGKTTMVRVIMNELKSVGFVRSGHNVKIGYFAQNQASLLDESLTAFDTIDRIAVGDIRTKIRDILGAFMFGGEDIDKKVKVLSGGERSRLAMIRLLLDPVNFLVLDEPTNHLDINSREILKKALLAFKGTLLVVSHDREFLSGLVDVVYEFKNKKIIQHLGGINDFLEKKKISSIREFQSNSQSQKTGKVASLKNDVAYEKRKEINRMISRIEKQVADCEVGIAEVENELLELDKKLSGSSSLDDSSHYTRYEKIKKNLENKMQQWEKLNEDLENWRIQKTW